MVEETENYREEDEPNKSNIVTQSGMKPSCAKCWKIQELSKEYGEDFDCEGLKD